jgi:hypothetical protein
VLTEGRVHGLVPMPEPERRRRLAEFERTKPPVASDVFISHAEQDRMWAEWIAFQLATAGYRVISQGPDFAPGADVGAEIDRTVEGVACTIAILTPDYVESAAAGLAWDAALARDPHGDLGSLLPVRVSQFRPHGAYTSRVPIDLVGMSADQAREELLAAMRVPGLEPHGATGTEPNAAEGPRYPGDEPQVFQVPLRNANFVGRDRLLLDIRARLASAATAAVLPQALHGLGGVGKTQVALEYCYRFAPDYDVVWWVPAEQIAEARSALTALAPHLGIVPGDDAGETLRAVLDALRRGHPFRRWLLVFDNADDVEEVQMLLPHGTLPHDSGHVIITSRNQDWSDIGDSVLVDVFTREESVQLLARRGRGITPLEADRLAARLGDLPLAIEQAAVWQAETGMPVEEYLGLFDEQLAQLLSQGKPRHYTTSVAATWGIAFERLKEQSPAALQLLELCAFFGAEPIPFQVVKMGRYAPSLPSPLNETISDSILRRRAVREIGRFALARVDPGRDTLVVHRLVQAVLRDRLPEDLRERYRASVHELMAAANPGTPDNNRTWPDHAALSPHVVPTDVVNGRDAATRKVVLDQVRYRYRRGDFAGSDELAEMARRRWVQALGPDDEQTLQVSRELASALWWLGRIVEARELRRETLDRMRRALDEDHEMTLITANGVGADLRVAGSFQQAREHDEDYYERHRRVFGDDDPNTLRSANNLAADLRLLGDFQRARDLDQEILERRRRMLREFDSDTLGSVTALAQDLIGLGHYAKAQTLVEERLADFRRVLGPNHYEVLRALRTHAVAKRRAGDYEQGHKLAEENLELHRVRFGEAHLDTLAVMTTACNSRRMVNDLVGAREIGEQTLEGYRRLLGPDHPFTFVSMTNLAIVLRRLGDPVGARNMNEAAQAGMERSLGADHPFTLCSIGNLANDLSAAGDHAGARRLSEDLVPRSEAIRARRPLYTLGCYLNLALDMEATGDRRAAERTMSRALAELEQLLGPDHPDTRAAAQGVRMDFGIEPPFT